MASRVVTETDEIVKKCAAMTSQFLQLPIRSMWIDYDKQADVLYMSFRKPQKATRTIERDDDILVRKDGRKIVGITILNASTRQ